MAAERLGPRSPARLLPTAQIQDTTTLLVDPTYDKLWTQQSQELDPQKRKAITYQMQQIFYQASPYIVLDYPKLLEAWNTPVAGLDGIPSWTGWERIPQPDGAVAFITDNVDNYRLVGPKPPPRRLARGLSTAENHQPSWSSRRLWWGEWSSQLVTRRRGRSRRGGVRPW